MNLPRIVSQTEWQAALEKLRTKEKELTRRHDVLAAERRRLPIVRIDKSYVFDGPGGKASLLDLFERRRQLCLYHFMFGPNQEEGCQGCSMFIDQVAHFGARYSLGNQLLLMMQADERGLTPQFFLPYGKKDRSTGWLKT